MSKAEDINPGLERLTKKREEQLPTVKELGLLHVLPNLSSDPHQFIYELLQNAEDVGARKMEFFIKDGILRVKHNGSVFTIGNVEAITSGQSVKEEDSNPIGKFGVGFKSVFKITERPSIHSGKFHFRIENIIVPKPEPVKNIGKQDTLFVLPLMEEKETEIEEKFIKLRSENLLFLSNIKEVSFSCNDNKRTFSITRKQITLHKRYKGISKATETTIKDGSNSQSFLVIESDEIIENKEGETIKHKAQIAFRQDKEGNIIEDTNRKAFVFFPTNEDSIFDFLVQAPYKTTPSRNTIDFKDKENKKITKILGRLVANSLPLMKDLKHLTPQFFKYLHLGDNKEQSEIYQSVRSEIIGKMKTEALLPGLTTTYIKAQNAVIPSENTITKLLNSKDLNLFFEQKKQYKWLGNVNIEKSVLKNDFEIPEIGMEEIKEKLDTIIERKGFMWLDKLYDILAKEENEDLLEEFKREKIVPLTNGKRITPVDEEDNLQVH
ncbi:MAG: hypothetical protein OXF42_07070, partial [Candidatus Dadabacteria bacterium]|nr:hypothetical protein [Candidatus Dadabacteria bacterium]